MTTSPWTHKAAAASDGPCRFPGRGPRGTQHAVAHHWENLPPQAKKFLLSAPDGIRRLDELVGFWSEWRPTLDGNAKRIMWSSLYLALVYLKHDMIVKARALMINGVFFHQLCETPIERVRELLEADASLEVLEEELPFFVEGFKTARYGPEAMRPYIECYLPDEYVQLLTPHADSSERGHVMKSYIDQISDGWEGPRKGGRRRARQGADEGTPIRLVFVDGANGDDRRSFDVGSRSTLRALFEEYAEGRGVSLRLLRFSHAGKTLFLSTAGNKTPEQLGMQDRSVINVHDTRPPEENPQREEVPASTSRRKKKFAKNKKQRKGKKGKQIQVMKPAVVRKTDEELKIEHSKMLDLLHAELQPRLKQIRQRLNNLAIERSRPKIRSKCQNPKSAATDFSQTTVHHLGQGLGGKAGRSHFVVNVGEVANLYKSMKSSAIGPHCGAPPLDLHGLTREDALARLNESLEGWVDAAMRGSYPFVTQATIVCGGGNQILRETVEKWIKSKENVSNAPKR